MEKLKLEHVSPYLPYGLRMYHSGYEAKNILDISIKKGIYDMEMNVITLTSMVNGSKYLKPILRPLSDLIKEIEHKGETFVPYVELEKIHKGIDIYRPINLGYPIEINIETADYSQDIDLHDGYLIVQKLLSWHFDVFRLIEKGLAIDINTL